MMQMIGLGGGKQDAVDPRPEQGAEAAAAADPEAIENSGQRRLEIVQRFRSGIERRQRIDQHDLAIEPREMIAEERPHHDVLVGLVAPDHHRPQRSLRRRAIGRHIERRKGQRRRAREIARHQEAAGRQQAHGETLVAAGAQVVGEQPRRSQRGLLVFVGFGIQRRKMRVPFRREPRARLLPRQRETFARPLLVALVEQRQVEQPFAGIVDDIERQRAVRAVLPLIVDHQPQFADIDRRIRPAPLLDQGADMVLVVEARHRVVGLRLEPGAGDPSGGERLEHRKAAAAGEAMDQRGDEDGLAGARQSGDAEPHRRIEKIVAVVQQGPRRQARFLDDIGKRGSHAGMKSSAGRRQFAQ